MHWPSKVWPVGMIARKICSTIERNLKNSLHHWTFHSQKELKSSFFFMTIGTLKSPKPRNRNSISMIKLKFLSASSMNTLLAFESHWREMWRHTGSRTVPQISLETPLPPPPWGSQKSITRGVSSQKSNPLPFCIPFYTGKVTLSYTFYWQRVHLPHT